MKAEWNIGTHKGVEGTGSEKGNVEVQVTWLQEGWICRVVFERDRLQSTVVVYYIASGFVH